MSNKQLSIHMRQRLQSVKWWKGKIMRVRKTIVGANKTILRKDQHVGVVDKRSMRLDVMSSPCEHCGCVVRMKGLKFNQLEFANAEQKAIE